MRGWEALPTPLVPPLGPSLGLSHPVHISSSHPQEIMSNFAKRSSNIQMPGVGGHSGLKPREEAALAPHILTVTPAVPGQDFYRH